MPGRVIFTQVEGEQVSIEVEDLEGDDLRPVGIGYEPDGRELDIAKALGGVRSAAEQVGRTIADLPSPPDSWEVTFGVKLSASLGAVIAKASGEANFTVKLAWKRAEG